MSFDVSAVGAPPGGTTVADRLTILRDNAAAPYRDTLSNILAAPAVRRVLKAGLPVFRPESYLNYTGDGTTNDTAAVSAMMTDVRSAGPCSIILPPTTTVCDPGVMKFGTKQSIYGRGFAAALQQSPASGAGSYFIDVSGVSETVIYGKNHLRNFSLLAGGGGCPAIKAYFNAWSEFSGLHGSGWACFLDAVTFWDAAIDCVQLEYCGGLGDTDYAMWFRNSGNTDGQPGHSGDTVNQNKMTRIRIEDCFGTAIRIEAGPDNGAPANGLIFDFVKVETNVSYGKPLIYLGPGVTGCTLDDIYFSVNNTAHANYSSVPDTGAIDCLVNYGGGNNTISKVRAHSPVASLVKSVIRHNATGPDNYSNISMTGNSAPTEGYAMVIEGGVPPIFHGLFNPTWYDSSANVLHTLPTIKGIGGTRTAGGSVTADERYIRVDSSAGAFSLAMPDSKTCIGHDVTITKTDYSGNPVTLTPYGADVFSDTLSIVMTGWHSAITLRPDSDPKVNGWSIVSQFNMPGLFPAVVSADGNQLTLQTAANKLKSFFISVAASGVTTLQSIWSGTAYTDMQLNPQGGNVVVKSLVLPQAANATAAGSAGVASGALYWNTTTNAVALR